MSDQISIHHVAVDDVTLYAESRGAGPPLLTLGGLASAAMSSIEFADHICRHHRLISFDRRGTYRSSDPIHRPDDRRSPVHRQADDVVAVLDACAVDATAVAATCAGASIALELLTRHPDRVTALLIHDPLTAHLVDDGGQLTRHYLGYQERATREGGVEAMRAFLTDHDLPFPEDFQLAAAREGERGGVIREVGDSVLYQPDLRRLQEHRSLVMVAASSEGLTAGHGYAQIATALAEALSTPLLVFPGNHSGYFTSPEALARATLDAFNSR